MLMAFFLGPGKDSSILIFVILYFSQGGPPNCVLLKPNKSVSAHRPLLSEGACAPGEVLMPGT